MGSQTKLATEVGGHLRCQENEIKAHSEWKKQTWCGPGNSLGGPCYEKAAGKELLGVESRSQSPPPLLPGPGISVNDSSGRNTCFSHFLGRAHTQCQEVNLPRLWPHAAFFLLRLEFLPWAQSFWQLPLPQTRAVDQEHSLCLQA